MQDNDRKPASWSVDTPWSPPDATAQSPAATQHDAPMPSRPDPSSDPAARHSVLLHWALMIVGFLVIVVAAKLLLG